MPAPAKQYTEAVKEASVLINIGKTDRHNGIDTACDYAIND